MAFNKADGNTTTTENIRSGATNTTTNTTDALGLGLFPTLSRTSEYVAKFKEGYDKFIKREDISKQLPQPTTLTLDRETPELSNLAYSYVVLAIKYGEKVYNHILVLDATRRFEYENPITIKDDLKQKRIIPVVANVLDQGLLTLINKQLRDIYPDAKAFINTNATFIPEDLDPVAAGEIGALYAYYAVMGRPLLENGKVQIVNLPKVAADYIVTGDVQTGITNLRTTLGLNKRADFKIEVVGEDKRNMNNNIRTLNDIGSSIKIVTNFGYIEYIPIIDETPVRYGLPPKTLIRPMVVINDITGVKPFIDIILTGVISSTMVTDPNILRAMLINNPKDIGILNFLLNVENEKAKYGKFMKFKSGKYPEEVIQGFITNGFTLNPIIALEIDMFEENFDQKSPLAALKLNNAESQKANGFINDVIQRMLGIKIAPQPVILNGYSLPAGYFVDAQGNKQDLRNISLIDVIEITKDPAIIYEHVASNLDGLSTKDQFECALDVYEKVVPNATITNERIRLILNPEWITNVASAAKSAGFVIRPRTQFAGYQQADLLDITKRYAQYTIDPRASVLGGYQQQTAHAYTSNFSFVGGYGR